MIGRKVIKNNGEFLYEYIDEIRSFVDELDTDLTIIKDITLDACLEVEALTQRIIDQAQEDPDFANAVAVDFLHVVGLLSFAYMFAKIAHVAQQKQGEFYANKLRLAQYYIDKVLPELNSRFAKINAGSSVMMQFEPAYFTQQ